MPVITFLKNYLCPSWRYIKNNTILLIHPGIYIAYNIVLHYIIKMLLQVLIKTNLTLKGNIVHIEYFHFGYFKYIVLIILISTFRLLFVMMYYTIIIFQLLLSKYFFRCCS